MPTTLSAHRRRCSGASRAGRGGERLRFAGFLALLSLAFVGASSVASADYQPRDTQAPGEHPPTPEESLDLFTLPEGFEVRLFAGEPDVRQPIAMALDERGRLWVAESYSYLEWERRGEDRILIFEDTNNDGRHDKRTVFWTGGQHVSGMTVGWGGVWVCDAPNLLFIPDRDRDDVPDGPPEVVLDGWSTEANHNFFNGLTWGPDGWLYGRHGITAPSSVGPPGTPEEERERFDCAIWRLHPATREFEVVCRGTTNPWGLDWNAAGEAFFTNNVNGHLWHVVHGAFYPRMGHRADPVAQHVYDRIPMCADHLHHAGTVEDWTRTRDGVGVHGELGGGHSHCGGMIYLGGKWPEEWRDKIFMCNTHGRRVNVDRLERSGSGYVGRHEDDFLHVDSEWFRGVQLLYGPDGDVYLSCWTDKGECHDRDGVHRSSGRIYKIVYGEPSPKEEIDLRLAEQSELVQMQLHPNEWFARAARHELQLRAAEGRLEDREGFKETLRKVFSVHADDETRLRLLLTLHVTGTLPHAALNELVHDKSEIIRAWAIRLCTESEYNGDEDVQLVFDPKDPSLKVRLAWASLLQQTRFDDGLVWRVAGDLAADPDIADDPNLPLMIWFGIKDRVAEEPARALDFFARTPLPVLHNHVARRLAEAGDLEAVDGIFERLLALDAMRAPFADPMAYVAAFRGLAAGFAGRSGLEAPSRWSEAAAEAERLALVMESSMDESATHSPDEPGLGALVAELELLFAPEAAVARMREALASGEHPLRHEAYLGLLARAGDRESIPLLLELSTRPGLASAAIRALASFSGAEVAEQLLERYPELAPEDRPFVIDALCATPARAAKLLDAIESERLPRHAVTAYHARQIHAFRGEEHAALRRRLRDVWGSIGGSSGEKQALIRYYQDQLLPDVLAQADLANGEAKYRQLCSACHLLGGEGGTLGPDLTGANREDLFYLLENIIDPSATLPQDYRMTVLTLKDGSIASGMVSRENQYAVTLRGLTDERVVDVKDIASRESLAQSLMPEGLLSGLSDEDVRDLIAYLQQ